MHPRIAAVATHPPPFRVEQEEAREYAARMFGGKLPALARLLPVFEHAEIATRRFCVPKSWFFHEKTFREKNDTYIEQATALGAEAAREALAGAGVTPERVDHLLFVSTTGMATPSIDARLMNVLSLPRNVSRVPVFGLGCAGGAMGLSQAARYLRGRPQAVVLLVDVELCSLTFQFTDFSKSNLIAIALFADGVAAAVIGGAESGLDGPRIRASQSTTWPDSLDVMGWNFLNEGMQVVFSRSIPRIVRERARTNIEWLLSTHGLALDDINRFVIHPGGIRVIEAYEEALAIGPSETAATRAVLREHGNMSSATVFYVLSRALADSPAPGELGVATALGPGFSAETVLLEF